MPGPGGGKRNPKQERSTGTRMEQRRPLPAWRQRAGNWLDRLPVVGPRRAAARITRAEVLQALPFRNERIEWEMKGPEDGQKTDTPVAVLRVPRRQDRLGKILQRIFEAPTHKVVVLDELGTEVWTMCDGATTVDELIRSLARTHKLERREVEVSLTTYLRTLARRGFIGLRLETAGEAAGGRK